MERIEEWNLNAALIVNPEEMFKIPESADEGTQELAKVNSESDFNQNSFEN